MTQSEYSSEAEIFSKLRADLNLPHKARDILKRHPRLSADVVARLLSVIVQNFSYNYFKDIVQLVSAYEKDLVRNPNAMMQAAFAAWAKGFPDECERWSKKLIFMAPNHPAGYLRLGLSCLTSQKFDESFHALATGMQKTNNDPSLIGWFLLAQRMATGPREVVFEKYGKVSVNPETGEIVKVD
jgi:hypothetical protein